MSSPIWSEFLQYLKGPRGSEDTRSLPQTLVLRDFCIGLEIGEWVERIDVDRHQ